MNRRQAVFLMALFVLLGILVWLIFARNQINTPIGPLSTLRACGGPLSSNGSCGPLPMPSPTAPS
jgi:hypothetical protein